VERPQVVLSALWRAAALFDADSRSSLRGVTVKKSLLVVAVASFVAGSAFAQGKKAPPPPPKSAPAPAVKQPPPPAQMKSPEAAAKRKGKDD
jgi:hypothetical protein